MSDESVEKALLAAPTRVGPTTELGSTGIKAGRPYGGLVFEEFLPKLQGLAGAKVYREMADNDPVIGAALMAIKRIIGNVEWRFQARDESKKAQAAAEWATDAVLKMPGQPFSDVVNEALSMLTYGFAPLEIVCCRQEDGTLGLEKLAIRSQDTVYRWEFDDRGNWTHLEQWQLERANVLIPRNKLLLFRTEANRDNPEGRSLLRNAFIPWTRKNVIEEAEGRLALRSAGIVHLEIPSKYLDPSDPEMFAIGIAYKQAADRLAADRQGSFVTPSDRDDKGNPYFTFDYKTVTASGDAKLTDIAERLDKRIAASFLADFILLGQDSVGSFALSSDKTSLFARVVGAILDAIRDPINRILLPKLWKLNAFDPALMPELKAGDLEARDLAALGAFLTALAQAGMPLFPTKSGDLEKAVMESAKLPVPEVDLEAQQQLTDASQPTPDPADAGAEE